MRVCVCVCVCEEEISSENDFSYEKVKTDDLYVHMIIYDRSNH